MFALNQKVGQQTLVNLKLMNKQTNWYRFRIFVTTVTEAICRARRRV